MSGHSSIHSWPASYYVSAERRWDGGVLSLTRTSLVFTSSRRRKREEPQGEEEEGGEVLLSLRLSSIMEIKMESSSFIFSTLTVLEEGNVKHWLGSLKPNRLVVYNVLEHFWRERLLSPGDAQARGPEVPPSKGKELLSLVAGAQRRMEDAGVALSQQGEQFDNMMQGLGKMDSDLGVADKLLSQLESPSWWPFGKLPWTNQQQVKAGVKAEPAASARNKVLVSIPAVVSRGGQSDLKPGCLLVLLSSLEVRDSNGQLLQRFQRNEIDEIKVHSPYEVSLRQRFIGRPDVCLRLLSAKMPEALSLLEMQYKKKVEFTREYAAFRATPLSSPSGAPSPQDHEVPLEVPAGELSQIQVQVLQPTVSQEEAQELRQMLLQLKSLALEAEGELERQDEVLEELTHSTERATLNIDRHTSRMRRLL